MIQEDFSWLSYTTLRKEWCCLRQTVPLNLFKWVQTHVLLQQRAETFLLETRTSTKAHSSKGDYLNCFPGMPRPWLISTGADLYATAEATARTSLCLPVTQHKNGWHSESLGVQWWIPQLPQRFFFSADGSQIAVVQEQILTRDILFSHDLDATLSTWLFKSLSCSYHSDLSELFLVFYTLSWLSFPRVSFSSITYSLFHLSFLHSLALFKTLKYELKSSSDGDYGLFL